MTLCRLFQSDGTILLVPSSLCELSQSGLGVGVFTWAMDLVTISNLLRYAIARILRYLVCILFMPVFFV